MPVAGFDPPFLRTELGRTITDQTRLEILHPSVKHEQLTNVTINASSVDLRDHPDTVYRDGAAQVPSRRHTRTRAVHVQHGVRRPAGWRGGPSMQRVAMASASSRDGTRASRGTCFDGCGASRRFPKCR